MNHDISDRIAALSDSAYAQLRKVLELCYAYTDHVPAKTLSDIVGVLEAEERKA